MWMKIVEIWKYFNGYYWKSVLKKGLNDDNLNKAKSIMNILQTTNLDDSKQW